MGACVNFGPEHVQKAAQVTLVYKMGTSEFSAGDNPVMD